MDFVLIDQTGGATTTDGSKLTPDALADIAAAVQIQLNRDAAPHYGGNHRVRPGSSPTDIQPNEHVHAYQPDLSVDGAIAYHDVSGNGVPYSLDGITLNDSLVGPGNSLSISTSHELLEIIGDRGCNRWAADGQGSQNAFELCDPVEEQSYPVALPNGHEVYVSNFVLQDFFTPNAAGPYDFLSTIGPNASPPPGPLQCAPGGGGNYQIVESDPADPHQVTAKARHVWAKGKVSKLAKRRHPSSRSYKRGLRV